MVSENIVRIEWPNRPRNLHFHSSLISFENRPWDSTTLQVSGHQFVIRQPVLIIQKHVRYVELVQRPHRSNVRAAASECLKLGKFVHHRRSKRMDTPDVISELLQPRVLSYYSLESSCNSNVGAEPHANDIDWVVTKLPLYISTISLVSLLIDRLL